MKRLVLAAAIAVLAVGTASMEDRSDDDPFVHHADHGEKVHVMPTFERARRAQASAPLFAPALNKWAVYPGVYGSGNLIDHGGPEMGGAGFWAIYWNGAVANSTATSSPALFPHIQDEMKAFIDAFPDTANFDATTTNDPGDDYEIVQQYGSHVAISNHLMNWGVYVDSQPTRSSLSDSGVQSYLKSIFDRGRVSPRTDTIYGVYFPPSMRLTIGRSSSCSAFCGYHNVFTYAGLQIKYAVFPYLNCSACKLSNLSVADMLTIVSSHEIRESVTDPGDNGQGAWYDAVGYEADDKCVWSYLYQMARSPFGFWVQSEYSNGGTITDASKFTASYPGPGCFVAR
jgi:hypothetical protein